MRITTFTLPSGGAFTAVDSDGTFGGVVPTSQPGATPVNQVNATATFNYPAAATTQLSVSVAGPAPGGPYVTAPATVTVNPGEPSISIPITFVSAPPARSQPVTLSIEATVVSASASFQAQEQPVTAAPALTIRPARPPGEVAAAEAPAT